MNTLHKLEPPRALPRWVIPVAVGGAVLSFVLLLGFALSLFWLSGQAPLLIAAATKPGDTQSEGSPRLPETGEGPKTHQLPPTEIAPDSERVPELGQPDDDSQLTGGHAAEVQQLADTYLEAQRDGTIYDLVPAESELIRRILARSCMH